MKSLFRSIAFLSPVILFTVVLSACNAKLNGLEIPTEIRNFELGYISSEVDLSQTELVDDSKVKGGAFINFPSAEMLAAAANETGWDNIVFSAGRVPYSDKESTLCIRTSPENAIVNSMDFTSSDESIIKLVKIDGKDIIMKTGQVGEAVIHVRVNGALNSVEADFPVVVVYPVQLEFYVNAFWNQAIFTRLRVRPRKLPNSTSFVTKVQDSVTVCGYCEWYDFRKFGSKMRVSRDTIRLPMEEKYILCRKDAITFIRNITSAVREFKWYRTIQGSRIELKDNGTRDTVDHKYHFIVEQVILDFNAFPDNDYYELNFFTKVAQSTEVVVEDSDEVEDSGTDENEDYDESKEGREMTREEKAAFIIQYNDFLSDEERARQSEGLRRTLKELGYDENMSDQDKQALIDSANEAKNSKKS